MPSAHPPADPLESVYEVDFVALAFRAGALPDEANAVLRLLDGRRALRQVSEQSGLGASEVAALVARLVADGVIRPVAAASPPVIATAPPPVVAVPEQVGVSAEPVEGSSEQAEVSADPVEGSPEQAEVSADPVEGSSEQAEVSADPVEGSPEQAEVSAAPVEGSSEPSSSEDDASLGWAGAFDEPQSEAAGDDDLAALVAGQMAAETDVIPVVRFPPQRGSRRERLEQESLEAGQGQTPVDLTEEVLAPGEMPSQELVERAEAEAQVPAETVPPAEVFAPAAVTEPVNPAVAFASAAPAPSPSAHDDEDDEDLRALLGQKRRPLPWIVAALVLVGAGSVLVLSLKGGETQEEPAVVAAPSAAVPEPVVEAVVEAVVEPEAEAKEVAAVVEEPPPPAPQPEKAPEPVRAAAAESPPPAPQPVKTPEPVRAAAVAPRAVDPDAEFRKLLDAGRAATKAENYRRAVASLEKAVELRPDSAAARRELGKAYYNADLADGMDRARAALAKAVSLDDRDAEAFLYQGIVLQELGRLEDARRAYQRVLTLEPAGSARHREVSAVLRQMDR